MSTTPPERPDDPADAFGEGRSSGGFEPPVSESSGGFEPPAGTSQGNLGDSYGGGGAATAATGTGPTPGKATASLVLGIVGLVFCPLICSVLAVVFGNQAKGEIASDPRLGGRGLAQAGVILGWVGIALSILLIIFYAIVVAAA